MKKFFIGAAFLLSSVASAAPIAVKISVLDSYSGSPINWQSGWDLIDIWAVGEESSEVISPERGGDVFVFPEAGVYTFKGRGAYVCGLNQNQSFFIDEDVKEIDLLGWCE